MDFELVIIGEDEKAYSLACACFDRYQKKAYLIGDKKYNIINNTNVINDFYDDLDHNNIFVNTLIKFASTHTNKYLVLVTAENKYIELIINNEKILKKYYLFNYCSKDVYKKITNPITYYQLLEKYNISFPQVYVQKLHTKINSKNTIKLGFPLVIKDEKQNFIQNVTNRSELKNVIKFQNSTDNDTLIVEKVDNSVENYYFSTFIYCNNQHQMEFSTLSCLELYNDYQYQVLINGYNIDNKLKEEITKVKIMLEDIGYNGFLELLWQYNQALDKYILLNLNLNIPMSSYMLVNCGYNLSERLVENLMYHKYYKFEYINYEICLSIIPKIKLLKQIKNKSYKEEINKLIKMNKYINLKKVLIGGKNENRNRIRS